mgnify:CR=1 FL=1
MRPVIICLLTLLLAGCSTLLENTEVAQFNNNTYKIKVTEYDEGLHRVSEVSINDELAAYFKPISIVQKKEKRCVFSKGYDPMVATCTFFGTYKDIEVKVVKVHKTSLAITVNYEIYFNDKLVEVVNLQNETAFN